MAADLWAVLAVGAFWSWLALFLMGIFRSFPARGVFNKQSAAIFGGGVLVTGALWVVALLKAP